MPPITANAFSHCCREHQHTSCLRNSADAAVRRGRFMPSKARSASGRGPMSAFSQRMARPDVEFRCRSKRRRRRPLLWPSGAPAGLPLMRHVEAAGRGHRDACTAGAAPRSGLHDRGLDSHQILRRMPRSRHRLEISAACTEDGTQPCPLRPRPPEIPGVIGITPLGNDECR